jgi:hypothetical protein
MYGSCTYRLNIGKSLHQVDAVPIRPVLVGWWEETDEVEVQVAFRGGLLVSVCGIRPVHQSDSLQH